MRLYQAIPRCEDEGAVGSTWRLLGFKRETPRVRDVRATVMWFNLNRWKQVLSFLMGTLESRY